MQGIATHDGAKRWHAKAGWQAGWTRVIIISIIIWIIISPGAVQLALHRRAGDVDRDAAGRHREGRLHLRAGGRNRGGDGDLGAVRLKI